MPDAAAPRGGVRRDAGPARHELPTIDDAALAAARETDRLLAAARAAGNDRWATFFGPLPDRLRDGDLRDLGAAARRVRAAFGPKDSVRDAFPDDVTEPVIAATDRLLKTLARHAARGDR
jgi:hypothetical protein